MKKRESRVICNKIDFRTLAAGNVDSVLANSRCRFSADPRYFKSVAVEMNRMIIAAFVFHDNPVASPRLYRQRISIRPGLAVDRPTIETAVTAGDFFKYKVEAGVRFRSRRIRAKDSVVPSVRRWLRPLGPAVLIGILDHDPHAHFPHAIFSCAEDPHTRLLHFDDGIDAFCGREH